MKAGEFLTFFNGIKPTYDELLRLDPALPDSVVRELQSDYELEMSIDPDQELMVIDLLSHSNISQLYFSSILFADSVQQQNGFITIGSIVEKGTILLKESDKLLYFFDERLEKNQLSKFGITDSQFLTFCCEYLKLYFDKVFRSITIPSSKLLEIEAAISKGACWPIFEELVEEIQG